MALTTGADYVREAGVLLNDVAATRYTKPTLLHALQLAFNDAQRLRPDLFMFASAPAVIAEATDVSILDPRYRPAVLEYIVGYCERIDQETSDTGRATMFYASFAAKMGGANT